MSSHVYVSCEPACWCLYVHVKVLTAARKKITADEKKGHRKTKHVALEVHAQLAHPAGARHYIAQPAGSSTGARVISKPRRPAEPQRAGEANGERGGGGG